MLIMAPKKNIWALALYISIGTLCGLTIGRLDAALTCASLAGSNSTTFPIPVVPNATYDAPLQHSGSQGLDGQLTSMNSKTLQVTIEMCEVFCSLEPTCGFIDIGTSGNILCNLFDTSNTFQQSKPNHLLYRKTGTIKDIP